MVDWSRPFEETSLGLINAKYVDLFGIVPCQYDAAKGQGWLLGNYNATENIFWVYGSRIGTVGRSTNAPTSDTWVQDNYQTNNTDMGGGHPIYIFNSRNVNSSTNQCVIYRPGGRSYQSLAWSTCTVSGYSSMYPFEDEFGRVMGTYWRGAKIIDLVNAGFVDKYWSDLCGMNIWIKDYGEFNVVSPKPWPLLLATDGEGDINFSYNAGDPHPWCSIYGLHGKGTGEFFFATGSFSYFAIINTTNGNIIEYLTPQDGNIFLDSYTSSSMKSISGHMRAGEALVLFISSAWYPTSAAGSPCAAARLKMNFQNLNP